MMKKYFVIIIVLTAVVILNASSPVALTLRMRGDVTLDRSEQKSQLTDGTSLINRDNLQSSDDSYAFIKFIDDGATLRLFPNSIMTINAEKEEDKLNKGGFLQVGNVFSSVNKDKGEYRIETPTTVASVKGTEGFVVVDEDGTTTVITVKGTFEVFNKESGRTIDVEAGNTAISNAAGGLTFEPTIELDEEWLESVDDIRQDEEDVLRIEVIDEDGQKKIIEIEFE